MRALVSTCGVLISVASLTGCDGRPPTSSEVTSRAAPSPSGPAATSASPHGARWECPQVELRGSAAEDPEVGRVLQRFFTALALGEPVDDMRFDFALPPGAPVHEMTPVLRRAAASHACARWYDGELVEIDDPELGILPMEVDRQDSGPPRVRTHPSDDAYQDRLATRELFRWLSAHPDARVSTAQEPEVSIDLVRNPRDSVLRIRKCGGEVVPNVPEGGRSFRIVPAISTAGLSLKYRDAALPVLVDGRVVPSITDVLVELDGNVYRLSETGLEPASGREARRVRGLERLRFFARAGRFLERPVRRAAPRIEPIETADFPSASALDELEPRELGNQCLSWPGAVLCCIVTGQWACADAATVWGLVEIDAATLVTGPEGARFESTDSGPPGDVAPNALHFLARDGDVLVEVGSLEIAELWIEEGTEDRRTWSYRIRAPRCVEYLEATHTRATYGHEGLGTPTALPVAYGSRLDELPRFRPRTFSRRGAPWLMDRESPPDRPAFLDRRGLWQIEGDRWRRVDRCEAQGAAPP